VRIQRIWSQIVGRHIAKRTSEIRLKNDTLFVRLNSAALRTELSFAKTKIIRNLNRQLGEDIIKEIVFI